ADHPAARFQDPGENVEQCRLPRSVRTDEANDLSLGDFDPGLRQSLDSAELLGDAGGRQRLRGIRTIVARIPRVNLIIDASGHLCSPLPFVRTTCPSEEEFIELPSAHQSLGPQIERDEDQKAQSELGKSTDLPDTEESEAEAILERLEEPHEHC